jgi:hypothetical protein
MKSNGTFAKAACLIAIAAAIPSCSNDVTGSRSLIVSGIVRVRDGAPLAGATVRFLERAGSVAAPVRMSARAPATAPRPTAVVTDAQGRYAIAVSKGHYDIWIGGGVADSSIMSVPVTDVTIGASWVSLDLSYPGYRVTGRMSQLGSFLASGSVVAMDGTNTALARLRDTGPPHFSERTYSLLLPAGTYDFWANPNEGYWGVPRVKFEGITVNADTTIDWACDGHFVQGHVTGPGGVILYGAIVSAVAPGASAWNYTDSNGFYGLHLPDGNYIFTVTPPPGADSLGTVHYPEVVDAPRTIDFSVPLATVLPPPGPP